VTEVGVHILISCLAVDDLRNIISKLELRVTSLEGSGKQASKPAEVQVVKPKAVETKKAEDDDDDVDLFGSDDDEEADEARKKRLADYAEKKSKSKSNSAFSQIVCSQS